MSYKGGEGDRAVSWEHGKGWKGGRVVRQQDWRGWRAVTWQFEKVGCVGAGRDQVRM